MRRLACLLILSASPSLAQCPGGACPYVRTAPKAVAPAVPRSFAAPAVVPAATRPVAVSRRRARRGFIARVLGR